MEVIKFVRSEESGDILHLYFKVCDRLAEYMRENSKLREKVLTLDLDRENQFCYRISRPDNFEEVQHTLVETIERISNEKDDSHFFNYLITNNGHHRSPGEIHALMHTEYGLADISDIEDENKNVDSNDIDLEWWTAHFFIAFERLLFAEADEFVFGSER